MLRNACMHRMPARAFTSCRHSAHAPVSRWWPRASVDVLPSRALLTPSSSQQRSRLSCRNKSHWCRVAATAQDAPVQRTSTACILAPALSDSAVQAIARDGAVPPAMKAPTTGYQLPPPEIVEIVDQPPEPSLAFSPNRKKVGQFAG